MDDDFNLAGCLIAGIVTAVVGLTLFCMFVLPLYNVWNAAQAGQAELAQADYNRQVQVVNAQANLNAQRYNAQAEVVRAQGVAQANNIVKNSITDQYIRYLWVQTLDKDTHTSVIYIPTEAGMPITEAGRASNP